MPGFNQLNAQPQNALAMPPPRPVMDQTARQGFQGNALGMRDFMHNYQDQMHAWSAAMQPFRHQGHPMQPPPQTNPGTQGQQVPNTQFPLNPGAGGPIQGQQYPMVGSSYNVLGMHPATSPYGLPTY